MGPRARAAPHRKPHRKHNSKEHNQDRNESTTKAVLFIYWLCSLLWCWRFGFGCGTARARPHIENHTASTTARNTAKTETKQTQQLFCVHIGCVPCGGVGGLGLGVGPRARGPTSKTQPPAPQQRTPPDSKLHKDNRTLATGLAGCVRRGGTAARLASPTSV